MIAGNRFACAPSEIGGKLKIAVLTPLYYPERFGGVEKVVYEITERLRQHYSDISIITGSFSKIKYNKLNSEKIYRIMTVNAFNDESFFEYNKANEQALQILKEISPDLIIIHDWFFSLSVMNFLEVKKAKLITQIHLLKKIESRQRITPWRSFISLLQQTILSKSDIVISSSLNQISELHSIYRVPKNKIKRIKYGIDENVYSELSYLKDKSTHLLKILYLGRFEEEKNLNTLIKSIQYIENNFKIPVSLSLTGSGSKLNELRQLSKNLDKSEVIFKEFLNDQREIQIEICNCDVLILPSIYDSYGLVCLEAISQKKPILVSNRCGIASDLKNYPRQLIFDPFKIETLISSIIFSINNLSSLNEIGKECFENFKLSHSWESATEDFKKYISSFELRMVSNEPT